MVIMELDDLKNWYKKLYNDAKWFKKNDLQWALDRKERLKRDFEGAVKDADNARKAYSEILDKRDFLLELIKARDPEFEGFPDEKEGV